MKKLNLGCGKDIKNHYTNLDSVKIPGVDIVHNLEQYPWPIRDKTFDFVLCDNILEHLKDIIKPVEELWRITKNGAKIIVKVPIYPSIWAMTDPTHKSYFTLITFDYFRVNDRLNYYSKARFEILKKRICFSKYLKFMEPLVNLNERIQKFYYIYGSFIIPAQSLYFELKTIK